MVDRKKRIAVIGSGISGLSAAWLLREQADVTLFEADGRFGGHTNTVRVEEGDREIPIDTGFMVFNRPNYPLLSALFDHLDVSTYATNMSFAVSLGGGSLEYAGSTLASLFAQRRNLARPAFWGMLGDILRFNQLARRLAEHGSEPELSMKLGDFLERYGLGEPFRHWYLYPMAAAIWSCPRDQMAEFPAMSFVRFFSNHGLVQLSDRPRWETVAGGSATYVNRLIGDLGPHALAGTPVVDVRRSAGAVAVRSGDGVVRRFDEVVFACHPDQALRILNDAGPGRQRVLRGVRYQRNSVYLHADEGLMPRRRNLWSSWNYTGYDGGRDRGAVSVTYWMNSLQRLDSRRNYFVSLNPLTMPRDEAVLAEFSYEHPVFDPGALEAQRYLERLQGRDGLWFCGAWTGYGFHEDGIRSGYEVARALGADIPWEAQALVSRDLAVPRRPLAQAA